MNILSAKTPDKVLAILVPHHPVAPGIKFFTDPTASIQVGVMRRPCGHEVGQHSHVQHERRIVGTNEVLLVMSGTIRVRVFDYDGSERLSHVMGPGDIVIFQDGGHSIEMLAESVILEVKQGPYLGKEDKVYHDA